MLDALELSESFTSGKFTDMKSAIAHYENQMFARFVGEGKITADFMDWTYSPDGLNRMVDMMNQLPN